MHGFVSFSLFIFPPSACTGNNFIWCWLFLCCHWMANCGHDFGVIRVHCTLQVCIILTSMYFKLICHYTILKLIMEYTLQRLLANIGSFLAKDTYSRLVDPTAIYQIGMFILELRWFVIVFLFQIQTVISYLIFLTECLLDFSIHKRPYRQRLKQLVSWKFI